MKSSPSSFTTQPRPASSGVVLVVDVVAVERQPRLEPQRVARAQADRLAARGAAASSSASHSAGGVRRVAEQLEAVLAGVAGAGDPDRHARDVGVGGEAEAGAARRAAMLRQRLQRAAAAAGPWKAIRPVSRRGVLDLAVGAALLVEPGEVLVDVGGVDDREVVVGAQRGRR